MPGDEHREDSPSPSADAASGNAADRAPAEDAGADTADHGPAPGEATRDGTARDGAATQDAREPGDDPRPEADGPRPPATGDGTRPAPANSRPPNPDPPPTRGDGADSAERTQDRLASAVNNFHGPVYASGSMFGTGRAAPDSQRRRARTGRLTTEDIDTALDHFVRPAPFQDAVNVLKKDRVIVLVGPASIGKAASAIALLREVTNGSLAILAPTVTISELAEREFTSGLGYVVMDWQHDRSGADVTDFTWRTLRDQVYDEEAHLVITTASARSRGAAASVRHFEWERPATRDLLASYLGGTELEFLIDDIVDAVPRDCGIGPIVALARRLVSGEDPARALEELGNDAAERVQQWFAAQERPLAEILEVVALAFATGRSERAFETMLARLVKTIEDAGYALDMDAASRKRKRQAPRLLRPVRADRNRAEGLISRETVIIEGAAQSVVKFRVDGYRHKVLAEGWHSYDGRFWDAIRAWLDAVVADSAVERNSDTQITAAAGLATLAQVDMSEVEDSYLHPWAGGRLGWPGQLVATYALWWMCFDDALAPVALRIATRWATMGDPVRRWTAATTFSGELGVRYPTEATNRLWHLIVQAKDSTDAIFALAQLFATLSAGDQNAGQVLILLDRRLDEVSRGRRDMRQHNLIVLSTLTVLSIRDARSGLPSITLFLRANPDRRAVVARLWGWVLRYPPLRRRALAALIDAVSAFGSAGDEPEEDARALGDALAEALWPGEPEHLATDFINHQAHAKRGHQDVAGIMRALIAALERLNGTETGEPE
jgi:hypothetical protein